MMSEASGVMETDSELVSMNGNSVDNEVIKVILSKELHFFVRPYPCGQTLVIHANRSDTIESIHEEIEFEHRLRIPFSEQRFVYQGRQLFSDKTLAECGIEKDSELYLVGKIRSASGPKSWQLAIEILSSIRRMMSEDLEETFHLQNLVPNLVDHFIRMYPPESEVIVDHRQVLQVSGVPLALSFLYASPSPVNKVCGENCIRLFFSKDWDGGRGILTCYAAVILDLCKQLSCLAQNSGLYAACRHALASSLELIRVPHRSEHFDDPGAYTMIGDLTEYAIELGHKLAVTCTPDLLASPGFAEDLADLVAFLRSLRHAIEGFSGGRGITIAQLQSDKVLSGSFWALRTVGSAICRSLIVLEQMLVMNKVNRAARILGIYGSQKMLSLLGELHHLSKLFEGEGHIFSIFLKSRKLATNSLALCVIRGDDHIWILEHRDILDNDTVAHFLFTMFPYVNYDQEHPYEMLIDRCKILEVSYEYIARSSPSKLKRGMLIGFKDEEATGPGVVREWFNLLCNELFDPRRPLFIACAHDKRRFFPNPASGVDSLHLQYFKFSGRVIAMALMYRVKVNVVLARSFALNLAGKAISLEDIKDEEPDFYNSCKQLLEMEAGPLDSGELELSFSVEYDNISSRNSVELKKGGKNKKVNSTNRKEFVDLLIDHRFSKRMRTQVAHFSQGFGEILNTPMLSSIFFRFSDRGVLDLMLHGGDKDISVDEWKVHTEYKGYSKGDCQLIWFWQVVESMTFEQKTMLLEFWTSLHHLPSKGFSGLESKLQICKHCCSLDQLPSSHTCFYQLMLPPYSSFSMMRDRLQLISQEYISTSFGMP